MVTFLFAFVILCLSVAGLGLGVLLGRRPLCGSCGGCAGCNRAQVESER